MHTVTYTSDVILAREFQNHLSNASRKNGVIDQGKKVEVNESGLKGNFMFRRMLMLHTNMLRCFIIQTNLLHCNFVFHTQNHMVSE